MSNDTSYIKDIGLVIWGCKGGYRIFCSNVVDVNQKDISDTLKDIRSFVYIRRHGVDYYAVEFTGRYKVYTHYRSSNDSGSGAFIAITIFVPHTLMIRNIREVLDEMVTRYFRDYVNPLNGTPLPGKFDEIRPFQNMLETMAQVVPDRRMLRYEPSVQNNIPKVMKYDDIATVDRYFENPYHKEFFDCQEVMFFRRDLVDNRAAFDIDFNREPEIIEKVTESVPMNRLIPFTDDSVKIASISVNGTDYTGNLSDIGLNPEDKLDIVYTREYHKDKEVSDTVGALVRAGMLSRQGNDYRMIVPKLAPEKYYLWLAAEGCMTDELGPLVRLSNNVAGVIQAVKSEKGWVFVLEGLKVTAEYRVDIMPNDYAKERIPVGSCRPLDIIKAGESLKVAAKRVTPTMKFPQGESPRVEAVVTVDNLSVTTPMVAGGSLVIPPAATVTLKANDYNVQLVDNTFVFTPKYKVYPVVFPMAFNRIIDSAKLYVVCDGKDYECGKSVKLPYGFTDSLQLKLGKNAKDYLPLAVVKDGTLGLSGTVIINSSKESVTVLAGNKPQDISKGSLLGLPSSVSVEFYNSNDGNDLKLTHEGVVYVIEPKKSEFSIHSSGHSDNPDINKKADTVKVRFVNCNKYLCNRKQITDGKEYEANRNVTLSIQSAKGVDLAKFVLNNTNQVYREFTLTCNGNLHTITYKPTFISRMVEAIFSKTGIIVGSVLLLAVLAGLAWLLLFSKKEYRYNITVQSPDAIASIMPLDSLNRVMNTSGSVMRFVRTNPVPAGLVGSERVVIDFGNEGKDTLSIGQIVKGDNLSDLNTFLKAEKPEPVKELQFSLSSPAPATRMFEAVKDTATTYSLEAFKKQYPNSKQLKALQAIVDEHVKAAQEAEARAAKEAAEAEAAAAAHKAVVDPYNKLLARLNSMTCSMADVKAVEDYQNAHKDELREEITRNAPKLNAYKNFFNPEKSPKSSSFFTKEQQAAAKYYLKYYNFKKKDDPKRDFKYAAEKLAEMGS